jgi:redox-sensitive bicupin YhaK (pirin superfamily)
MATTQIKTRDSTTTAMPAMKNIVEIRKAPGGHWVGDGFPVRTMFGYDNAQAFSPFLLMDYAGPLTFPPSEKRRGVGEHPHRGFETVTIVYSGEVEHRDSAGGGGKIGPGDVQWMTAGAGLVHEEMHSQEYTRRGGKFEAIQLWVNLPKSLKMTRPKYQTILSSDIVQAALPDGAGTVRVIAGEFFGAKGPAETFTPMNLWDVRLNAGGGALLQVPPGHTASVFVMEGMAKINGKATARAAEIAVLDRQGEGFRLDAEGPVHLVVLSGEPIDEPVFGYGPFVMNTEEEIRQAIADYNNGKMGHLSA